MTNTFAKTTILATIALGTFAVATPALAGPVNDQPKIEVDARGIDLTSPDGIDRLAKTVRRAAHNVCHSRNSRALNDVRASNECYQRAIASANAQIDSLIARKVTGRSPSVTTALADTGRSGN